MATTSSLGRSAITVAIGRSTISSQASTLSMSRHTVTRRAQRVDEAAGPAGPSSSWPAPKRDHEHVFQARFTARATDFHSPPTSLLKKDSILRRDIGLFSASEMTR
eukprot:3458325-Alexandrium_andersonii.AAC.1